MPKSFVKNKLKVAAVNSWSQPLAVEGNIAGIQSFLDKLESENIQFALFPELCISGYINNTEDLAHYAKVHKSTLNQLIALSDKYNITFSVGLPMPLKGSWGIGQVVLQAGEIIHCHYKTHLSVHEKQVFIPGDTLSCFTAEGFKIGLLQCLESHYPELSLGLQQKGAHMLCFAFASPRETPEEKLKRFKIMLQARAYDNACFVMACNQTGKTPSGKEYAGAAVIISPRADVLAQCAGMKADYCVAELDLSAIEKIKNSQMSNFPAYRNTLIDIKFKPDTDLN